MVRGPRLVAAIIALLASLGIAASLGAPWYRVEIVPFAAGQTVDVTAWDALSGIDVALLIVAAVATALTAVGLATAQPARFAAAALAGALAAGLVLLRLIDQPFAREVADTGNVREVTLVFGGWVALVAACVVTVGCIAAARRL